MPEVTIGTTVRLMIGGPTMVVNQEIYEEGRVRLLICTWFDKEVCRSRAFAPEVLMVTEAEKPEEK